MSMKNNLQPETIARAAGPRPFPRLAGLVFGMALIGIVLAAGAFTARPVTTTPEAKRKAVLVELFTSEGCSSCPPADTLLAELRRQGQQNGTEIIPLGFHVDYWNYLGWRDRFSSSAYSRRQENYARGFSLDGPYTPQMVIDGQRQFTGSDSRRAREAIAQDAAEPQSAEVQLSFAAPGRLLVSAIGENIAEVKLAITEDNLASNVGGGENNGRMLRHTAVVRDLRTLGKLTKSGFQAEVPLTLPKEWKSRDLRFVVFIQQASGRIDAAASLSGVH
jgi:hypothetical protein